jgi:transposase
MRKSFDGLAGLIRQALGSDPLSGEVFVFRNKTADRVQILTFEGDGLVIWYKRLERGTRNGCGKTVWKYVSTKSRFGQDAALCG